MVTSARTNYHHGDLRTALIAAAEAIIQEDGIEGFSLRKATAKSGVTAGASKHHFNGVAALLTQVAIRFYEAIGKALANAPNTGNNAEDIRNQVAVYVAFAAANPGKFKLACRIDLIETDDEDFRRTAFAAMRPLGEAAARYHNVPAPDPAHGVVHPAIVGTIATAHGLAHLELEGRMQLLAPSSAEEAAASIANVITSVWPDRS